MVYKLTRLQIKIAPLELQLSICANRLTVEWSQAFLSKVSQHYKFVKALSQLFLVQHYLLPGIDYHEYPHKLSNNRYLLWWQLRTFQRTPLLSRNFSLYHVTSRTIYHQQVVCNIAYSLVASLHTHLYIWINCQGHRPAMVAMSIVCRLYRAIALIVLELWASMAWWIARQLKFSSIV